MMLSTQPFSSWNDLSEAPMVGYDVLPPFIESTKSNCPDQFEVDVATGPSHLADATSSFTTPSGTNFVEYPNDNNDLVVVGYSSSSDDSDVSSESDIDDETLLDDAALLQACAADDAHSTRPLAPSNATQYYHSDFVSWEDQLFGAALVESALLACEQPTAKIIATAKAIEQSSSAPSTSSSSSSSSSPSPSCTISSGPTTFDATAKKAPVRRRKRKTPSAPSRNTKKQRRRGAAVESPTAAAIVSTDNNNMEAIFSNLERFVERNKRSVVKQSTVVVVGADGAPANGQKLSLSRPLPALVEGKIGLVSTATHSLSDETIRSMFESESVVTISSAQSGDDEEEDVDIL